jgi:hypothetical protein
MPGEVKGGAPMTGWLLKRGSEEYPIPGGPEELQRWAIAGKVRAEDYVYNPVLEKWMYARDTAEVAGILQNMTKGAATRSGCGLGILLMILGGVIGLLSPTFGGLIALVGLVVCIAAVVKSST